MFPRHQKVLCLLRNQTSVRNIIGSPVLRADLFYLGNGILVNCVMGPRLEVALADNIPKLPALCNVCSPP